MLPKPISQLIDSEIQRTNKMRQLTELPPKLPVQETHAVIPIEVIADWVNNGLDINEAIGWIPSGTYSRFAQLLTPSEEVDNAA
jgi:hypothetical protein